MKEVGIYTNGNVSCRECTRESVAFFGGHDAVIARQQKEERHLDALASPQRHTHGAGCFAEEPGRDAGMYERVITEGVDDRRIVTEERFIDARFERHGRQQAIECTCHGDFPTRHRGGGSEPGRNDDGALQGYVKLLQVAQRDEAAHGMAQEKHGCSDIYETVELAAEAVDVLQVGFETF